jgi:hypothetical protein
MGKPQKHALSTSGRGFKKRDNYEKQQWKKNMALMLEFRSVKITI